MERVTAEQVLVSMVSAQHHRHCPHVHAPLRDAALADRLALVRAVGPERALAALQLDPTAIKEELRAIQRGQALVCVEDLPGGRA